jgi:glycerophosphoryl diester phosphodiesterase
MIPLMVAHRGAMADAPENTGSAFDKAIACFADGIELDVQITKDGVPVLYHDTSLKKINGVPKPVSEFTHRELSQLDWGGWFSSKYEGEPLLTLENLLSRYADRTRLFIEIKDSPREQDRSLYLDLALRVVEAIRHTVPYEHIDRMFVLSFDPEILKTAYLRDSELAYVLNLHRPSYDRTNINEDILYGACVSVRKLNSQFIEYGHRHGKKILTYGCNTPRLIDFALDAGVDVVMTDDPCGLHEYFVRAALK